MASELEIGTRIEIRGTVQGVGFRPWIWRLAHEHGISGRVSNDSHGVTIEAFGVNHALEGFLEGIRSSPPPAAEIREIKCLSIPPESAGEFRIESSREAPGLEVSIPPDLATCADCLSEIFDPRDRRFRYAFTNCTNCGPRFTIVREVPYDRPATAMAPFKMCPLCQDEYDDPSNRRFHAQPNACPSCGPRLEMMSASGQAISGSDPIAAAAAILRSGMIVAVKGLGGFHLACDAASPTAVARLRQRKHREEKPFAVMVRGIEEAGIFGVLSDEEKRLLLSPERPIVLVSRRKDSGLAPEVSPDLPIVGLMLPYTPVHHLLLSDAGAPLVMTSGNLSENPIVCTNADAVTRLNRIADGFLLHDREIESRCDDSVARIVAGGPVLLRRSRGWVPRPIPVATPFDEPVLACGGHLKNTFCFGLGNAAYLGPHIGDLENMETLAAFEEAVERMEGFLRVRPELIAHDMHPQYVSTIYARGRSGRKVAVQHHHAHVASAMAEHGLAGPVIGLAFDGTGYGTDGTAWGGEILLSGFERFERLAAFRPISLAGGDVAIREPWRIALALLEDAFPEGPPLGRFDLFSGVDPKAVDVVRQMLKGRIQVSGARGVGRYFDGFGALFLARPVSRHEGQIAAAWNVAADTTERESYPFDLDESVDPPEIDLRRAVRAAAGDFCAGASAAVISGRFHNTLAGIAGAMVRRAVERVGDFPVVLTGGCFQNALLAERILEQLGPRNVFVHRRVPPGDGGLALGQAVVAAARARSGGF